MQVDLLSILTLLKKSSKIDEVSAKTMGVGVRKNNHKPSFFLNTLFDTGGVNFHDWDAQLGVKWAQQPSNFERKVSSKGFQYKLCNYKIYFKS